MAASNTARTVKLWEDALPKIDQLPAGSPSVGYSQQHAAGAHLTLQDGILPTVDEFVELPKLHPAVWTKLLAELKVPLQLGQAASSTPDPLASKATAAVAAIGALIHKAQADDHLQLGVPNALSQHFGQQLKQSGFLAALPKLLEAAATALADTWQNPEVLAALPYSLDHIRSSMHSAAVRHVLRIQELAAWLLFEVTSCVYFWPQQFDREYVAAPALRLGVLTMQHCSRYADLITPTAPVVAAMAPTALEHLMGTAYTASQTVFSAWDPERLTQKDFDISTVLTCPDAMRALCCITMVPIICPQQFFAESQQLLTSIEACNSSALKVGPVWAASDSNSLAAWQYACAHASDVTAIQQQTLQALGCSSRLFMHMAGSSLNPAMTSNSILASSNLYLMLVRHSAPLTELDRPEGIRQLAETLQQLQKGATPPGTSPLLPCAPLLWLMPAVLLEWAAKQPARGPHFAKQNYMFSMLFWPSVDRVLEQRDCWAHAESEFFEAAGGHTARLEQRQAMLNTMRAMMLDGIPVSSILSASPQTLAAEHNCQANAVTKMYQSASEVAYGFCEAWTPPAVCLAQLLQQVGGAATRMLACMQAAAAADPAGSSGDSSSSGTHSNPGSTKPSSSSSSSSSNSSTPRGHGNRNSHSRYGDIAPVGSGDDASMLSIALLRLSQSTVALLSLSYRVLWNFVNKAGLATRHDPIWGLRRDGDPNKLDDEEQANLNTLCAAVQETLPQLASLVDAAVRTTVQEELRQGLLAVGSNFLNALLVPGVFVAAGLQPGSHALKPLASLTATLLKVVGTVQASPAQDPDGVGIAALALRNLMNFSSIVLEVACGANGSSGSGSSAVIAVLTGSKAVSQHKDNTWSAEGLTTISKANKPAPSSSSGSGSSGSGSGSSADDDGSGGIDAVALVPWLVGLGRCCLGCVGTMRCLAGGQYAQEVVDNLDVMSNALQGVSAVLPSWLHSPNVSAQLASAGYVTESLPKLLKSVSQAHQNAAQAGPTALAQVTQELGLALSSLPFGSACNNPLCRELSELSEQQLVVGSARRCSGCRVARYCSKTCQKVHWKQHKPACKAINAATTAPNAAA